MGTTSALTTKEAIVTPKFLSKEEQGTTTIPKYSSKEESEVATSTRQAGRPRRPPPYIPPHKRFRPPDSKRDNQRHPNYKPQNTILSQKYVCLLEFHCSFLQGREVRHINTPTGKSIKLSSETPE